MASTCRKYSIIVINVPTPAELGILWRQSGLQALAEAIAADLRQPEIGGIIEMPLPVEGRDGYQAYDVDEASGTAGGQPPFGEYTVK